MAIYSKSVIGLRWLFESEAWLFWNNHRAKREKNQYSPELFSTFDRKLGKLTIIRLNLICIWASSSLNWSVVSPFNVDFVSLSCRRKSTSKSTTTMKILNEALTGKLFMQSKSFNLLLVLVDMREGFCLYQARAHCVSLEIQNLM